MTSQWRPRAMAATKPKRAFAPAKINLFLHVMGRRTDGYHDLESLVAFVDVGDELTATPAPKWSLAIDGPHAEGLEGGDENLVLRAARAATAQPHAFQLTKNLPVASGIGGGSADAAAALRLCAKAEPATMDIAASVGADVPACLCRAPAWMGGAGERLTQAHFPGELHLVLVNGGTPVSTAEIFKAWQAPVIPREPVQPLPVFASNEEVLAFLLTCKNDLEAPARAQVPEIGLVVAALEATDKCRLVRMSGSGGTCFGIYASEADAKAAAKALQAANTNWWVKAATTITPDPTDQWVRLMQNATMS